MMKLCQMSLLCMKIHQTSDFFKTNFRYLEVFKKEIITKNLYSKYVYMMKYQGIVHMNSCDYSLNHF